jgi:hypothetical protein
MPATWPATLPQEILVDGNSEAMGDGRLRSQTDTGPGKVRRRSTAMARPLSGSMMMSDDQLDAFEEFVLDDLGGGSLPFLFPKTRGGEGTWLVRFGEDMPSWANVGPDLWTVTMSLEILP